jgi:antitoxin component of MazEF toxin-antitoxin module
MTKKLVRHGNSAAIILDKPILELLNLTMDTPLEISTDGQSIVISPATADSEDHFRASLDRINAQFAPTLARLAE